MSLSLYVRDLLQSLAGRALTLKRPFLQVFEVMGLWPILNRAKVEASHAEDLVKETMLHQAADEAVQTLGNLVRLPLSQPC